MFDNNILGTTFCLPNRIFFVNILYRDTFIFYFIILNQ